MVTKNPTILKSIVETIILCTRQNIALCGHDEESGNFRAILHDKTKHGEVLKTNRVHTGKLSKIQGLFKDF